MGTIYTQLSLHERRRIEDWWLAKVPVAEMARVLKRHKSTIFREIKRNFWADDAFPKKYAGYFGMAAHQRTQQRRSTQRKLIRHPELCKAVIARISYDRQRIILQENEITRGLPGKYVDSFEFPDGRLEFRWKGVSLPYSVFDKDQRVTHAAITENKHLSAVLAHIKAEQDKTPPKKCRAGKQRSRYKPNGRRNDGWNSLADRKRIADRKASQGCDI